MRSYLTGLAVLTLATVTLAFGQPGGGQKVVIQRDVRGPEKMSKLLNLSADQEAKIQKLRTDMQRLMVQHRSKVQLARIDLRELMDAEAPDRSAIEKKFREISDLQVKQKMTTFDHRAEVEKLLTPEQKKIWREHRREAGQEVRQRFMRRMGGGQGYGRGMECGPGMGAGSGSTFQWTEAPDDEKEVTIIIDEEDD